MPELYLFLVAKENYGFENRLRDIMMKGTEPHRLGLSAHVHVLIMNLKHLPITDRTTHCHTCLLQDSIKYWDSQGYA